MESPSYRPRQAIGFCRFDGCTIVLDTHADRYWQFGESVGTQLAKLETGSSPDPDALARLKRLNLIEPAPAKRPKTHATIKAPRSSVLDLAGDEPQIEWRLTAELLLCQTQAQLRLALLPLRTVLKAVAGWQRKAARSTQSGDLVALARAFRLHRGLTPWTPSCLPDTVAFMRFATRHGFAPRMVFGVEAYPFAAHCWAQADDVVLNDAFDHAARFKPIYVL